MILLSVMLLAVLLLTACGNSDSNTVDEIALGDGLPTFELQDGPYKIVPTYSDDDVQETLYTAQNTDAADVCVYSYGKADGQTLESFGQDWAAEYNVFCNMTSYDGYDCANVTYYKEIDGEDYIIRSYIFESEDEFKIICFLYKTEITELGESGKVISLINGYSAEDAADSVFPDETDYEYEDEYLPTIRIREFAKDYFTADTFNEKLMPDTTREEYSAWAEDGWTLEEAIEFYDDNYELLKGELIQRNGLDVAFIGYIDEGVFYVRAVIDCGDEYIMLCAENDAAIFQHVVNALIDTID